MDRLVAPRTRLVSWTQTRYAVLDLLGAGGNAEVYRALATNGPHKGFAFAVKLFRRAADRPGWLANFHREIHLLRQCRHPGILRVFDEGLFPDAVPFVVTELMPATLRSALPALPFVRKIEYAMQLASALDYLAHRDPPVVHRDIKPENVFVRGGSCVLGDFGLVKYAGDDPAGREPELPSSGPGMPRFYRTPDLVRYRRGGASPGPPSDVYQLGLVLAEMFTGTNPQRPPDGSTPVSPVERDVLGDIADHSGAILRVLLEQMLDDDPNRRPEAATLVRQLIDIYQSLPGMDAVPVTPTG